MSDRTDIMNIDKLNNFRYQGLGIPQYMYLGILRYLNEKILPGSFLRAVISNDLREAVNCADDTNQKLLHVYVCFFYNETPAVCWGSPEKMKAWIDSKETVDA